MKLKCLLPACLLLLIALPAAATPYPRYIQRQVTNGTMSLEEADMLVENGLGSRPTAATPLRNFSYASGQVYDPLATAQAESAYNERVNEARYYGDIQQRDERFYGRNHPAYGRYYRNYFGEYYRNPIGYRPPTITFPVTGGAFSLPPVRTLGPLIPPR